MTDVARNEYRAPSALGEGTSGAATLAPDEDEVIEAVIMASRALVAVAARSLGNGADGVTLPQYRTLVVLSHDKRRLADLAEALSVSPSTATRMCDRLVRKGLITRNRDEIDRREVNLEVTPAGRTLVAQVIERRRAEVRRRSEEQLVDTHALGVARHRPLRHQHQQRHDDGATPV
jgi:DNA-binding MarR family transcriptional regulator